MKGVACDNLDHSFPSLIKNCSQPTNFFLSYILSLMGVDAEFMPSCQNPRSGYPLDVASGS